MANKYSKGFYNLMAEAGIASSESFSAYIKQVLGFGESQALNLDGFPFEPTNQLGFDYKQMQIENRIKVMATYTDKDSEAIPFGSKGFETSSGIIPRQKARFIMDEDDYRKYLQAVQELDFQDMTAKEYALNLLFTNLSDIKDAHETSMTYQRDQMVSKRELYLDADNNPRGIKGLHFYANVPDANITTKTGNYRWFTNDDKTSEGSDANPVKDVKDIIRTLKRKGYTDITLEVDEVSFYDDMNHSKWQTAIGYKLMPSLLMSPSNDTNARQVGANASDEDIKRAFAAVIGIPVANVKLRQGLVGVEKLVVNETTGEKELVRVPFRSFAANTYVFYPSGNLGTVKTVAPLLPDGEALYGTVLSGKGIIQYEYDAKAKTQDWWSELTCLCVPNRPQEMYYLETYGTASDSL